MMGDYDSTAEYIVCTLLIYCLRVSRHCRLCLQPWGSIRDKARITESLGGVYHDQLLAH